MNPELSKPDFELFQRLLVDEIGIHFDHERQGLLRVRLGERMAARRIQSVREYFDLIQSVPEGRHELRTLVDLVTVGETHFFRNQAQFDALTKQLLPALIRERAGRDQRIAIWSAACSTGDEPYSIAIALLETLPNPETWNISLLASDVNRGHLKLAQEAVYGPRAVRNAPPVLRSKYFVEHHGSYALADSVKRLVHFRQHNLVKGDYAQPDMQQLDFIFCRNVIIYFPVEVIRRMLENLARCLAPGGYLFVGDAETLWNITDRFEPVEFPNAFGYRLATKQEPAKKIFAIAATAVTQLSHPPTMRTVAAQPPSRPTSPSASELGRRALRAKNYEQALAHFREAVRLEPNDAQAHVGQAIVLANQHQHEDAIVHLLQAIRCDNLCAEAYYLLGVLYARTGRTEEAVESLQQAVYTDPGSALAYFSLGNIFRAQGQPARAKKQFENAVRAVRDRADDEPVNFSDEDITCGYLRRACQRSIELLSAQPSPSARSR